MLKGFSFLHDLKKVAEKERVLRSKKSAEVYLGEIADPIVCDRERSMRRSCKDALHALRLLDLEGPLSARFSWDNHETYDTYSLVFQGIIDIIAAMKPGIKAVVCHWDKLPELEDQDDQEELGLEIARAVEGADLFLCVPDRHGLDHKHVLTDSNHNIRHIVLGELLKDKSRYPNLKVVVFDCVPEDEFDLDNFSPFDHWSWAHHDSSILDGHQPTPSYGLRTISSVDQGLCEGLDPLVRTMTP